MLEETISRVLSPEAVTRRGVAAIHLAPLLPTGSSNLPGSSDGPSSSAPLFGLAPDGVYRAPAVTSRPGELLPHPFTLTPANAKHRRGRFPFCGTFLPVTGTGGYPAPCPVEPGLSSPRHSISRKDLLHQRFPAKEKPRKAKISRKGCVPGGGHLFSSNIHFEAKGIRQKAGTGTYSSPLAF